MIGVTEEIMNRNKRASVLGDYNKQMFKAIELLRKFNYRVYSAPASGIPNFEANLFSPDQEPIQITDIKTLRKFLEGKPVIRSM